LANGFRDFSPWSPGFIASRPITKQKHHGGQRVVDNSGLHGSQEAERERREREANPGQKDKTLSEK
jgi:hypothetical protein